MAIAIGAGPSIAIIQLLIIIAIVHDDQLSFDYLLIIFFSSHDYVYHHSNQLFDM